MNRAQQYALTIVHAAFSHSPSMLAALIGLLTLSSCDVSYNTIDPELIAKTRHFGVFKKNMELLGQSVYVVNDSSGNEVIAFTISSVRSESKRVDWALQISSTLRLLFEREHSLQVDITNDADSTKRTLIYLVHETTDGAITQAALGDTALILDASGRIGCFNYPFFLRPKSQEFEVELNGFRTTIKHQNGSAVWNDSFIFKYGDEYVASIGNADVKSFGNVAYNVYVKNNVTPKYQRDLFFFYVATRALNRIQDEIANLQKNE
jgi:hypothetical protein